MDPERFERVRAAVIELEGLPPADRRGRMDEICGDDGDLRAELESLFAPDGVSWVCTSGGAQLVRSTGEGGTQAPSELSPTPESIGPYRLLGLLGRGGMGEVYLAEQTEPIRREVAIKRIAIGLGESSVLSRFEQERQVLARMEHPGIARVLDAGADDLGRPYFVMEVVRGEPITILCDARELSLRERMGLFEQVCRAIHHAHQKGVIHRDIKPSNILVTEEAGRLQPKIIDFGVAKSTSEAATSLTTAGQVVGTLGYMVRPEVLGSPEGEPRACCIDPAGASPVPVSAGAPGSRPRAGGEIPRS